MCMQETISIQTYGKNQSLSPYIVPNRTPYVAYSKALLFPCRATAIPRPSYEQSAGQTQMTHIVHQASWKSQELATFAKTQTTSTKLNISILTLIIRIKNGLIMNAYIHPFMLLTPHSPIIFVLSTVCQSGFGQKSIFSYDE